MSDVDTRDEVAEPREVTFGDLEALIGFHLRMAHTAMHRDFTARFTDLDLTQRQCGVLEIIHANPGVSQVTIAAMLGTDRATMMATIDRLQARGLVERRRSIVDRRKQELTVTRTGEATLQDARGLMAHNEARFGDLFTPHERNALIDCLRRMHAPR